MAHAIEGASFAKTPLGKRVFLIIAVIFLGSIAALFVAYMLSGLEEIHCATSEDQTLVLSLDKEQAFILPSDNGCWTPWLLRPTKARGFQYTADLPVMVGVAYADGSTRELVYDPKFGNVDQKAITAVRFKNDRTQGVLLRLLVK